WPWARTKMGMRAHWAERAIAASADGWRSIHELRAYHLAAAAPFARFDRGRHRALAPQPPWTGGRSALGSSARRRAAHRHRIRVAPAIQPRASRVGALAARRDARGRGRD